MKIGEKIVYSQNGSWGTETTWVPTSEFATGKEWKIAKKDIYLWVERGDATLIPNQEKSNPTSHTIVWDVVTT